MQGVTDGTGSGGEARILSQGLLELRRLLDSASAFGGASDHAAAVGDEDDDSDYVDEEEEPQRNTDLRHVPQRWFAPVKLPQEAGVRLLMGGEFGRTERRLGKDRPNVNLSRFLRDRGTRIRPLNHKEDVASVGAAVICVSRNLNNNFAS